MDNQIITLQKIIEKERKKEELSKIILGGMKNIKPQQMNQGR